MKDQLITILEALRLAQNIVEVDGHTQETLDSLRSTLCSEDVRAAVHALSFLETPPLAAQSDAPFLQTWRHRLQAA
jgi:hypothetical protein